MGPGPRRSQPSEPGRFGVRHVLSQVAREPSAAVRAARRDQRRGAHKRNQQTATRNKLQIASRFTQLFVFFTKNTWRSFSSIHSRNRVKIVRGMKELYFRNSKFGLPHCRIHRRYFARHPRDGDVRACRSRFPERQSQCAYLCA